MANAPNIGVFIKPLITAADGRRIDQNTTTYSRITAAIPSLSP